MQRLAQQLRQKLSLCPSEVELSLENHSFYILNGAQHNFHIISMSDAARSWGFPP
ncbi:hypothetical protein [Moorena producens]|uniref:hypothetical protein n=1 Tax=Moorena producens TaxID=1155739 RepID=UPI00142BB1E9|nr:hypothetical protein [Moorena sp. SIO4G3]